MANTKLRRGYQAPRVIHVAVLECQPFPQNITDAYGPFTRIFEAWLQRGAQRLNAKRSPGRQVIIETSRWLVHDGLYPENLTGIDAFLVTGSLRSSYDDLPWIRTLEVFLKGKSAVTRRRDPRGGRELTPGVPDVYEAHPHIKIYGSCFGHQIVAQALLGPYAARVEKSEKGWEVGVHNIRCSPEFVKFFPCLRGKRPSYQFFHRDEVVADCLPEGWTRTGSTELCATQGLFQPGRVLTDQGHPELDRRIMYYFVDKHVKSGAFDSAASRRALKLIERDVTSGLAAEVAVRFLEG